MYVKESKASMTQSSAIIKVYERALDAVGQVCILCLLSLPHSLLCSLSLSLSLSLSEGLRAGARCSPTCLSLVRKLEVGC